MTTKLRGATVRRYLERVRDTTAISGATEHTFRAPLIDFLKEAAAEQVRTFQQAINAVRTSIEWLQPWMPRRTRSSPKPSTSI